MSIKGLIFDMDGLLVDTERLSFDALVTDCKERGYTLTKEQFLGIRSLSLPKCEEKFRGYFGDDFDFYSCFARHTQLMNKHIDMYGVPMKKGADTLLEYGKSNGYRIALATATPLDIAKRWLTELDLWRYFDRVQSSADIKNGKPAPDVYLAAADKLGLEPIECMAFEDSPNGVRSAAAAGCVTVMVPDMDGPDEELSALARYIIDSLEQAVVLLQELGRN